MGASVFCCSGTASGDPCQFFSFRLFISLGTACGDSVFCLSQTFVKVRAPPVATLLFHLISSHLFSWHRLWRHSFLLFGHRQWRPLSFHITASFLWAPPVATQFSFLSYSELYVRAPSVATLLCHVSSSPHLFGLRLWRLSFLFCHYIHTRRHTYIVLYPKPSSQRCSASVPILTCWHGRCGAGLRRPRRPRDRAVEPAVQVFTATHGKHTSP